MSTKIYNGYKFRKPANLLQIKNFCVKLQKKITPLAQNQYKRTYLTELANAYDRNQFGFFDDCMYFINKSSYFNMGIMDFMSARMDKIAQTRERDPQYDFNFSITIHPLKNGEVLLLLFTERSDFTKAFDTMKEIQDYHYQNQSDRPSRISEKKWNQRKIDWDEALGGDGWATPIESGLSFTPFHSERLQYLLHDNEQRNTLMKYLPTIDIRATAIAKSLMADEWDKKHPINLSKSDAKSKIRDLSMDRYWKYVDYCKTDEAKKELQIRIELVKPQIRVFSEYREFAEKIPLHDNVQKILSQPDYKPYWYNGKR